MVRTEDKPLFDNLRVLTNRAKQIAYRVWSRSRTQADWENYRMTRRHAQHVYVEAERAFNEKSRVLLTNAPNPRKSWSTVKTAALEASSSLPPLVDRGVRLIWSADEKVSLFSPHFDAKQCRVGFQQPHPCHPSSVLCSVACRSSSIPRLLLDS